MYGSARYLCSLAPRAKKSGSQRRNTSGAGVTHMSPQLLWTVVIWLVVFTFAVLLVVLRGREEYWAVVAWVAVTIFIVFMVIVPYKKLLAIVVPIVALWVKRGLW